MVLYHLHIDKLRLILIVEILYDKWKETAGIAACSIEEETESPATEINCTQPVNRIENPPPEINSTSPANATQGLHQASKESLPLSEIMDMEYALQLIKEEKRKNRKSRESNIAMKLKRQKLYEMFPCVNTKILDDTFEENNYNLSQTIIALEKDIGKPAKTSGKFPGQTNPTALPKPQLKQKHAPDLVIQGYGDLIHPDAFTMKNNSETVLDLTIITEVASFRIEAMEHCQLRREYMDKAHEAYCKGISQLATFYAQKGSYHGDRFNETNKRASELIVKERNNSLNSLVLDLHGLYVKEVIQLLRKFLSAKKKEFANKIYGE